MSDTTLSQEHSTLTGKQKKYLKGLAHSLTTNVQIGKEGITEGVLNAITQELELKELVKIKIGKNSNTAKEQGATELATATSSHLVQIIGKTIILYKKNPELKKEQRIQLPKK